MAWQAEAEREKRAKIIAAEGEAIAAAALGEGVGHDDGPPRGPAVADSAVPCGDWADKNSTVVFPAPLMSTIAELSAFLAREDKVARAGTPMSAPAPAAPPAEPPAPPIKAA